MSERSERLYQVAITASQRVALWSEWKQKEMKQEIELEKMLRDTERESVVSE